MPAAAPARSTPARSICAASRPARSSTSPSSAIRSSAPPLPGYDHGMSEPPESAPRAEQIAPGLWHWSVNNSNIGGNVSASHAVATDAGSVWIDPVRVDDADSLPAPEAIVLTSRGHQRSAWHYREQLGVQVWAPQGGEGYEQQPDVLYGAGDELPGGLRQL